mmetsp:Transcript_40676/g.91344  ORF Transcript_40676/g.91344 Transcript_40676/m.91344 type:complete len:488 (+) Transcript_40676:39-1502(+)
MVEGGQTGLRCEETVVTPRVTGSSEVLADPHLQQKLQELEQQVHSQADRALRQAQDTLLAGCVCFWLIATLAWFTAVLKGQLPFATFAETVCGTISNDGKVFVAPLALPAVLFWMSHYVYVFPNASLKAGRQTPSGQGAARLDPPHLFVRHYVVNALLVFIALLPTFQVFHTYIQPPPTSPGHASEASPAMLRLPSGAAPGKAMLAVGPPLQPPPAVVQSPLSERRPAGATGLQPPVGLSFAELETAIANNGTFLPLDPSKPMRSGQFTSLIMASSVVSVHQTQVWLHACSAVVACSLFAVSELYLCLCHPLLSEDELMWRKAGLALLSASLLLFMLNKISSQVSPSMAFFLLSALLTKLAYSKVPTRIPWSQCFTMLIALGCVVFFQPHACVLGLWTFRYDMLIGAALVWQQQLIWAFSSQLPHRDWFTIPVLEIPACCLPWGHIGFVAVLVDDIQMAHTQGLWEVCTSFSYPSRGQDIHRFYDGD